MLDDYSFLDEVTGSVWTALWAGIQPKLKL